ncbi:MAG TPA: YebC/PmpR family DNA-binding transcriptional regulator [Candidatus Paceibacterota bacterium]
MSGHNKWSQIKHKKAKTDAQKSKQFSKFSRLITEEARKSKGDKNSANVRAAIERAHEVNMPNDAIERAIKKATESSARLEMVTYEAYGPGGCAMIIEAFTANKNKATQEVKFILTKNGFSLATPGSASWAFERHGIQWKPTSTTALADTDLIALEKLIDELEDNEEVQEVFTNVE